MSITVVLDRCVGAGAHRREPAGLGAGVPLRAAGGAAAAGGAGGLGEPQEPPRRVGRSRALGV